MSRRLVLYAVGGWAAIPVMAFLTFAGQSHRLALTDIAGDPVPAGDGRTWILATVAMVAVLGGMAAAGVADAVRAGRAGSEPDQVTWTGYVAGVVLSAIVWFFGGIVTIGLLINNGDCGTGAASPCLDRPGAFLSALSAVFLVAPTPLLAVIFRLSLCSRVCALLAPPFIASTYLLAVHLSLPHVSFTDDLPQYDETRAMVASPSVRHRTSTAIPVHPEVERQSRASA